jgi:hypothetical protein
LGSDDEDEEYVPKTAEYWKKEVRIGDNYQVGFLKVVLKLYNKDFIRFFYVALT